MSGPPSWRLQQLAFGGPVGETVGVGAGVAGVTVGVKVGVVGGGRQSLWNGKGRERRGSCGANGVKLMLVCDLGSRDVRKYWRATIINLWIY